MDNQPFDCTTFWLEVNMDIQLVLRIFLDIQRFLTPYNLKYLFYRIFIKAFLASL